MTATPERCPDCGGRLIFGFIGAVRTGACNPCRALWTLPIEAPMWRAYEQRKAAFLAEHPEATPEEVEQACRRVAEEEGL